MTEHSRRKERRVLFSDRAQSDRSCLPGRRTVATLLVFLIPVPVFARQSEPNSAEFFESRIRPLLVRRCLRCHGDEKRSGGLRVDSRGALLQGGERGPALVPGKVDASLLVKAVRRTSDDLRMPPDNPLPQAEVQLLERWIATGAAWPVSRTGRRLDNEGHWSFQPIEPVTPPAVSGSWVRNPIDAFILTRLHGHELQPVEPANPRTLIRRAYFDLTGLPPSWEDVEAFVNDPSEAAWRQVIERLLESPQYGERWGRHWLDLARYADTQGGSVDCPIPQARLYRDYVIDSFTNDKPYDEFLREQIAGDIIAIADPDEHFAERIIATGFLGLSIRNGIFKHYHPELIIEDTIDTIGRSILGMTVRCARCHDHKFEPISTADYYRLYGIFASSRYPFTGSELPQFSAGESVPLITPQQWDALSDSQRTSIETLRRRIADTVTTNAVQDVLKAKRERLARDVERYHEIRRQGQFDVALRTSIDDQDIRIREDISRLDNSVRGLWNELKSAERAAGIERAYAMREEDPHDAHVHVSGDPFDHGPLVPRGVPERLAGGEQLQIPTGQSGRLQLAEWLTSPTNPLTPRVAVNYIWQFHFGTGLVTTPDDFGLAGSAPSHPKLLDWLAREFIDSGWSIKHLHRLILTSSTWRLSSQSDEASLSIDPANRWRWRFDRRRLDAESIRDSIMQVAGTLDHSRAGPHPFPPEADWRFSQHGPFKAVYDSPHRSVYLMTQRLQRHPFLTLFDGPDTSRPTAQRRSTAKALQALYLSNSPFIHEQANALAGSLINGHRDPRARITAGIRRAWSRSPARDEVNQWVSYLSRFKETLAEVANWKEGRDAKLLLEYRFEGDAKDSSGNEHHGKLVGEPEFVPGKSGKCISFHGDGDFVDSGVELKLGDEFVVECFVRPAASQNLYADIFGNHLAGGARGFVLQQDGNNTNRYRASYGMGADYWVITEPVSFSPNKWQHVAVVRTPAALRLYRNGKLEAEVESEHKAHHSELPLRIGLGITLVERCFRGQIDDVRVYRGIPVKYREPVDPEEAERECWSSFCRLLLTANEFLYLD